MTCTTDLARGAAEFVLPTYHSHEPVGGSTAAPPTMRSHGWRVAIDTLGAARSLADDWDGMGAVAPVPALVDSAISLAQTLQANGTPAPNRTHAGVNGTLFFEWYTPAGYAELEVIEPTVAEQRLVPHGSNQAQVQVIRRR